MQPQGAAFDQTQFAPEQPAADQPSSIGGGASGAFDKTQFAPDSSPQPNASQAGASQPQRGASQPQYSTLAAPAALPSNISMSVADNPAANVGFAAREEQQPHPATAITPAAGQQDQQGQQVYPATIMAPAQAGLAPAQAGMAPAQAGMAPAQPAGQDAAAYPPTMFAPGAHAQAQASGTAGPGDPTAQPAAPAQPTARPVAGPRVLASQSIAAEAHPVEPGRSLLRWLLIIGGVALIAAFCAPRAFGDEGLVFSWDKLSSLKGVALLGELYLAGGGLLMLLAGALPLPYLARGIAALVLGLIPLGLQLPNVTWRPVATQAAILVLAAALIHRYHHRGSILARVLVAAGVVGVLTTLLVPLQGTVPLVAIFELFGKAPGASALVLGVMPLLLLLLSLLSLLAYLGRGSTGLAQVWATALLLYLPLTTWLATSFALAGGSGSLEGFYAGLALAVCLAASAIGLAHIFSRMSPAGSAAA